ncbi:hypothetical protein C8J57DRAFT_1225926 [Mycena rebaudengoi]|nr:hypothetical protein C8J57DRAFT_1225926 [Mycena rebaudengoi]
MARIFLPSGTNMSPVAESHNLFLFSKRTTDQKWPTWGCARRKSHWHTLAHQYAPGVPEPFLHQCFSALRSSEADKSDGHCEATAAARSALKWEEQSSSRRHSQRNFEASVFRSDLRDEHGARRQDQERITTPTFDAESLQTWAKNQYFEMRSCRSAARNGVAVCAPKEAALRFHCRSFDPNNNLSSILFARGCHRNRLRRTCTPHHRAGRHADDAEWFALVEFDERALGKFNLNNVDARMYSVSASSSPSSLQENRTGAR